MAGVVFRVWPQTFGFVDTNCDRFDYTQLLECRPTVLQVVDASDQCEIVENGFGSFFFFFFFFFFFYTNV